MKKIIAVTTNFGYGPVSKLHALLKGILNEYRNKVDITFYGEGESYKFLKRNLGNKISYVKADSDFLKEKIFDQYINSTKFDLLVNVMNLNIVKMMPNLSIKNIFVDSLNWMWPKKINGIDACDMYIIQNYFSTSIDKVGVKNWIKVNPILDIESNNSYVKSNNIILINFSGIMTPNSRDNFFLEYVKYYLNVFSNILNVNKYKIICSCNSFQISYLKNLKFKIANIEFRVCTHTEFLKLSQVAYKVFSTPGLTFYLESKLLGIEVYYLLPSNYSQALLMEKYRKEGTNCNSLSSFGNEYIIHEKMEEEEGVKRVRQNFRKIKQKFQPQIEADISQYIFGCVNKNSIEKTKKINGDGVVQILAKLKERKLL